MTIICACAKGGEIAISADTQVSHGRGIATKSQHMANFSKLFTINGSTIGFTGYSSAKDSLVHLMQAHKKNINLNSKDEIFRSFMMIHKILKEDYFLNTKTDESDPAEYSHLHLLLVNKTGIYEVTGFRNVTQYQHFWAIGSGDEMAIGAMYAAENFGVKTAKQITEIGVKAACEYQTGCSLPLKTKVLKSG